VATHRVVQEKMTLLDILQGLGFLLLLIVGVTVLYMLVKGGWTLLVGSLQATARFGQGVVRQPRQAVVDAPFWIQLLLLPFLLAWERWCKWRHPEEAWRKNAVFKKIDTAAKVFQSRLGQVALYREGRTITLCTIASFEVGEHLVRFDAEPVAHPGFSEGMAPWHFSINWDYFFYDAKCWAADCQFLHWRVNFDDERIEKLKAFALTLPPDMDAEERYRQLNHFFTYGRAPEPTYPPEVVDEALAALKTHIESGADLAWMGTLPEALQADVNIMSVHAFPGDPDSGETVVFGHFLVERPGRCLMWVAVHPNPWRLEFSQDHLIRWWRQNRGDEKPVLPDPTTQHLTNFQT
jgi:hypothetical protein